MPEPQIVERARDLVNDWLAGHGAAATDESVDRLLADLEALKAPVEDDLVERLLSLVPFLEAHHCSAKAIHDAVAALSERGE